MEVVTGVASSVVEKILEYPVRFIGRHLGYLICYQTNKKSLADQVPELDNKISIVQRRALAAQRNGEQLEECVTGWIKEAERKVQEAKDLIDDRGHENAKCLCNGSFPNLVARYKLSKQAKLMADNILIDLQNADNFRNFSYHPDVQPSFKNKDYEAFDTRMQTSKEIMEALRDPNLTMIGVYGMGGIGKTTLVNDVARQAKEEECFSELVMVTVSQDFDLKSIQNGIAEGLGLTLDGENMSVRAKRLQNRLRQGNKILIILDDIWDELDLSKAGIDFNADDQKGCKILLVSRVRDVLCNKMGVRKIIEVKVLSDSEAQGLFNKFVGDIDDNSNFKELVNQVVGECGGLPIAIVTIACSLKNKDLVVWKGFLSRLQSSCGLDRKVYASIKMSYDFLESEEEKKLLLLCSLHGEDANVFVDDLMFYGIGLDLFQEVRAMEEARCWAHSLVDKLKAHCLLLDGDYEGTVKMHDVIRDVMISIAKKDEHMHCLTKVADLEDCLHKENFRDSKAIVLVGPDFNNQLLPSLVCPKIQLLLAFHAWYPPLSLGSIPDDFFQEAQELKALSFCCMPLESLPQSFCTLRHLRALRLRFGKKVDLTLIGELRNLIALNLSGSTFSQLPEHIGKLTRLQSLNLSYCSSLRVIQPNVISSLVRLEELYMDKVNIDWEVEGRVGEGCNASLLEFKNLRNLTTLHLIVRDANVLPKDMFSENLQRYRIVIGSSDGYFTSSRFLYLNLRESSQLYQYGIQKLMKNSEWLWLEEFHGVDNIVYEFDGFPQLKNFCLKNNDEVRYIVHSTEEIQPCSAFQNLETLNLKNLRNLEKICYDNVTMESFGKLRKIYVTNCDKLKNLFSFSIARKFEEIDVRECKMMETLVYHGSEHAAHGNINNEAIGEKLEFPQLRYLNLNSLSNLIFFWSGLETTCGSSLSDSPQPLFGEKVVFPRLKVLQLSGMNFIKLWSTTSCMQNLSSLDVSSCRNLKYLFTVAMAGRLAQLESLQICGCPEMEELVVTNEHGEGRSEKILFPKLQSLKLEDLPNLKRFCTGDCIECPSLLELTIENCGVLRKFISSNEEEVEGPFFNEKVVFPSLKVLKLSGMNFIKLWSTTSCMQNLSSLDVSSCRNLKYLFTVAMAGRLAQLESLQICGCPEMEEVVVTNEHREGRLEKILFPKLKSLELKDLPNLKRFCTGDCIECPSLLTLEIRNCGVLRKFISSNEEEVERPFFNEKVVFPSLKVLKLSGMNFIMLWSTTSCMQNLSSLDVSSCRNLKYLFTVAMAGRLAQLESLQICGCPEMEEVVVTNEHREGRLEKILFPKLKSLELKDLPNLKRFCTGDCIECPSLLTLEIKNCGVLRKFISGNEEEVERPFFNEKVVFPSLKVLKLSGMNFIKLWSTTSCMQNLSSLDVSSCRNLKYLFTVAMAGRLAQLESLQICGCPEMEEVVVTNEHGEGKLEKILFPKLKSLELKDLPNLKRFCTGDCIECPSLLTLEIRNCGVLRKFISSNEEEVEGPFFNEKVSFPILEELQLKRMNLKILWADQLSITSFGMQNLKRLFIKGIDSLSHLFSLDVAISLQQLEDLRLEACKDMEEVLVTKEPIEEGTPQKISFPKLKNLVLSNLQNIRRFCAGCCIEFPSLTNMTFITDSCNGASGELMGSEARQPLFNGKVLGPNLVGLTTTSSELIKEMCDCQSSRAPPFCNLKVVDLKCFRNEPIGFSLKCIQRYQNLESLSLSGFFVDTTHHHQQLMVSSEEHERPLKLLKKLWLLQLSMLTHLYEDSEDSENNSLESLKFLHILECGKLMSPLLSLTTSFQNLMALVVSECSAMINLLASSTAKTLVHLKLMSITECKQMTEIITDGIVDDEIVFRNLEILELSDLPCLRSFHSARNSVMRFPNLVMLVVSQCPEMKRFSFGTIDAPKLDSISEIKKNKYRWDALSEISFDYEMSRLPEPQQKLWEGDINKTLEKLWEEDYSLVMQRLFTET